MSIQSFADVATEELFRTGSSKAFANIAAVATRRLTQLDSATTLDFMRMPPGNDLKFYEGFWHIRVNRQWRLAFKWSEAGPKDVKIYDPH